jgi:uncharacterized protein HemY
MKDLDEAVAMLFEAYREQDRLRIDAAMRHLEFMDSMARLQAIEDWLCQ